MQFNLTSQDDLGNSLQLPTYLTSMIKWPEGATNEPCDTWRFSTTMATCPLVRPKMTMPKRENDQQCSMTVNGATPRPIATPSTRAATVKNSLTRCKMMDPTKWPREWVRAYVKGMRTTPNWWPELLTLNQGCLREVHGSRP